MELEAIQYPFMAESIRIKVGARIKAIRKKKNMTQAQLGVLTGIKQPNIYKYEKGQQVLGLEVLDRIAKALGVNIKELL